MSGMKPFNWNEVARVFLVSRPEPCPYLPDRQEQKLITLIHPGDEEGFQALSKR